MGKPARGLFSEIGLFSIGTVAPLFALGGWAEPDGGWEHVYQAGPGQDAFAGLERYWVEGGLDGLWKRLGGSDRWDGSAPGEVDAADPDGPAPGGLALLELPGQGYEGETIGVLALEDPGDPSDPAFSWEGIPMAWTDDVEPSLPGTGSNRKIFLGMNLDRVLALQPPDRDLSLEGVTLSARFRLTPRADAFDLRAERIGIDAPQGSSLDDNGKGFINLFGEAGGTRKLGLALDGDAESGWWLQVGGAGAALSLADPAQWLTVYATLENPEADGTWDLRLYADGWPDPFYEDRSYVPPAGGSESGEERACGSNDLALGSHLTPEVAAYELDFLCIRRGVFPPEPGAPPERVFLRGDADGSGTYTIADAIQILERLFAGRERFGADCEDTGDVDDNGALTIGDAIWLLYFLFAGGADPEPPFPRCGLDPTPMTALGCHRYPLDRCP